MPSGDSHDKPALSLAARKQLLLVACTIDRLNLLARLRPQAPWYTQLSASPWLDTAATFAMRVLPPKLRLLTAVWRTWSRSRR